MNLDQFFQAYIVAALWSTTGPDDEPYACEHLDDIFNETDLSEALRAEMRADCEDFIAANAADLALYDEQMGNEEYTGSERAGHDFWLTREGHGVGFWDRGLGDLGERLTAACKPYGDFFIYPGDDGKLYS